MEIKVLRNILEDNMHCAQDNANIFKDKNIVTVNVMASPGSGKTSLISRTWEIIKNHKKIYAIEGDIESSIDANRLCGEGIDTLQINTGGSCHLNANMIGHAVQTMNVKNDSILFIENVGNLVCTAAFDLGENYRVVILSVPEGHDKPYKYPKIFENADAVILNKMDLIPYIDFDKDLFYKGVRALNSDCPIFEVSCKDNSGIDAWGNWLKSKVI